MAEPLAGEEEVEFDADVVLALWDTGERWTLHTSEVAALIAVVTENGDDQ